MRPEPFSSFVAHFHEYAAFRRFTLQRHVLRSLVMLLLISGMVFAFARIASAVVEGETLGFDRYVMLALRSPVDCSIPSDPRWFNTAVLDMIAFGGIAVISAVAAAAAGYLVVIRKPFLALLAVSR